MLNTEYSTCDSRLSWLGSLWRKVQIIDVEKEVKAIGKLVENAFEVVNRHDLEELLDSIQMV